MTFHGTVQNGVVVLDGNSSIPDGTQVAVVPISAAAGETVAKVSLRERRRAALAELLLLPNEDPGDKFSGADHDQALYGDGQ